MFSRVSKTKTLVVGSLESDLGSEFLFGYEPALGLKWLERKGQQYGPGDAEWRAAETFLNRASAPTAAAEPPPPEAYMEAEAPEMVDATVRQSMGQPQQVTRSTAADGWDDPYPMEGDPRIVGDMSESGVNVPDEDIAAQAASFLAELGEEE